MKQENKVHHHIQWYWWFIVAVVLAGIGFAMLDASVYRGYRGGLHVDKTLLYFGWFFVGVSGIFDILALKALITEAVVKALEVFHGKERAVRADEMVFDDVEKTSSNGVNLQKALIEEPKRAALEILNEIKGKKH